MVFLILIAISFLIFAFLGSSGPSRRITCDMKNEPHKWVEKTQDEHGYLVCEECGLLPGQMGLFEENDNG
jgi:hypothetical protein